MPEKSRRRVLPGAWCDHDYPIEVCVYDGGRRARCLRCYAVGPVREDADSARRALLEEKRPGKRQKPLRSKRIPPNGGLTEPTETH